MIIWNHFLKPSFFLNIFLYGNKKKSIVSALNQAITLTHMNLLAQDTPPQISHLSFDPLSKSYDAYIQYRHSEFGLDTPFGV